MKRLFVLSVIVLVTISCKKSTSNSGSGSQPDLVVGNWTLNEIEFSGTVPFGGNILPISGEGENMKGGYTLNTDGTMSYDYSCDLVITTPALSFPFSAKGSGTWNRNGEVLELNDAQSGIQRYSIKAVTTNTLIIEQDTSFAQGPITADLELEITLKK